LLENRCPPPSFALHHALFAQFGHVELVHELIQRGCDVYLTNGALFEIVCLQVPPHVVMQCTMVKQYCTRRLPVGLFRPFAFVSMQGFISFSRHFTMHLSQPDDFADDSASGIDPSVSTPSLLLKEYVYGKTGSVFDHLHCCLSLAL
jgi:hypothetical protein